MKYNMLSFLTFPNQNFVSSTIDTMTILDIDASSQKKKIDIKHVPIVLAIKRLYNLNF